MDTSFPIVSDYKFRNILNQFNAAVVGWLCHTHIHSKSPQIYTSFNIRQNEWILLFVCFDCQKVIFAMFSFKFGTLYAY